MRWTRNNLNHAVTAVALLVLLAALPWAILDTLETGRVYLFSWQFVEELPQRFSGPGRFRFILQPLVAILLGGRDGLADARAGQRPYLYALLVGSAQRKALMLGALNAIRNLMAMGITLDALAQFLIYGQVHPGAALLIGPVLICIPYAVARALANRLARLGRHDKDD
jgi:hypothetical protein